MGGIGGLARRVFDKYDSDKDGHVTMTDFKFMAMEMGHALSPSELEMAMKLLDADGNHTLEFDEFQTFWSQGDRFKHLHKSPQELDFLSQSFSSFLSFCDDRDRGVITPDGFARLHTSLGQMGFRVLGDMQVDWDEMDSDHSGEISFNEYVDWIMKSNGAAPQGVPLPQ